MPFFNRLRRLFLLPSQAEPAHPFDLSHHVDTSGLYYADRLPTGHAHDRYSEGYYATAPSLFHGSITLWISTLDPAARIEDYRFIDLGCGKGRVVLMASQYPFKAVRGIELSTHLTRFARRNLRKWQRAGKTACADIRVESGDVMGPALDNFLTPNGAVVLFLFNAFTAEVVTPLMEKLAAEAHRRAQSPRSPAHPIDIIYMHPDHDQLVAQVPGIELLRHAEIPLTEQDARADLFGVPSDVCSVYRLRS